MIDTAILLGHAIRSGWDEHHYRFRNVATGYVITYHCGCCDDTRSFRAPDLEWKLGPSTEHPDAFRGYTFNDATRLLEATA